MAAQFKSCSVEGCNGNAHPAMGGRRDFCSTHYRRLVRHGDPLGGGVMRVARGGPCSVAGCSGNTDRVGFGGRGMCTAHYLRWKRHGDPLAGGPNRVMHGMARARLYKIWFGMLVRCGHRRCSNPLAIKNYRDKGIRVCEAWQEFSAFREWARSNGYTDALTIDRIDGSGGYEPDNCRWITPRENGRTRTNIKLSPEAVKEICRLRAEGIDGATLAKRYGVRRAHIYAVANGRAWTE